MRIFGLFDNIRKQFLEKRYVEVVPEIDVDVKLRELGFDENQIYDVPKSIEEANEMSIRAHIKQCRRNSVKYQG